MGRGEGVVAEERERGEGSRWCGSVEKGAHAEVWERRGSSRRVWERGQGSGWCGSVEKGERREQPRESERWVRGFIYLFSGKMIDVG
jgi:hypothetical protein